MIAVCPCFCSAYIICAGAGGQQVSWDLVNENYCFLGYKNIDWDKVYTDCKPRVESAKEEFEFFDIMCDLVDILRDGHSQK